MLSNVSPTAGGVLGATGCPCGSTNVLLVWREKMCSVTVFAGCCRAMTASVSRAAASVATRGSRVRLDSRSRRVNLSLMIGAPRIGVAVGGLAARANDLSIPTRCSCSEAKLRVRRLDYIWQMTYFARRSGPLAPAASGSAIDRRDLIAGGWTVIVRRPGRYAIWQMYAAVGDVRFGPWDLSSGR